MCPHLMPLSSILLSSNGNIISICTWRGHCALPITITLSSLPLDPIKRRENIINTMSTPSSSKLYHSRPTTTNMLTNKTFLFAVAAAFMTLAIVEAAPAIEAVQGKLHLLDSFQPLISWLFRLTKVPRFYLSIEHAACVTCDNPPPCTLRCPRGYCVSASLSSFWTPKLTFFLAKHHCAFQCCYWYLWFISCLKYQD